MNKPDYEGGSIVNLMSTIVQGLGFEHPYNLINGLDKSVVKRHKNIVLMVIDGLGYKYLQKYGKGSFLEQNIKKKITTVFPTTTASAITAFETGLPTQQHGLVGWFTYFKEIGVLAVPLRFQPRYGGVSFREDGFKPQDFLGTDWLFDKLKRVSCSQVMPTSIVGLFDYKKGKTNTYVYKDLKSFLYKTKKSIVAHNKKKLIYAYWSKFDASCHINGVNHPLTHKHFKELDKNIELFTKRIRGTNTLLIITADHGLIDVPDENIVNLNKEHAEMMNMLVMPMSGDSRVKYCFVKNKYHQDFKKYVKKNLSKYCDIFESEYLLKNNYFGLFEPTPKIFDRIGDYTIIVKDNYLLWDTMLKDIKNKFRGHHSALTDDELFVPLIYFEL